MRPTARPVTRRALAAVVPALLVVGGLTLQAAPAVAAAAAAAAGPQDTVTLALTPADQVGLAALAGEHGLPRAMRARALAAVLPSRAQHRALLASLAGLGLRVVAHHALSVTVRGPAGTVDALFGTAGGRTASPRALPDLPAALAGLVTAAFDDAPGQPAAFARAPMATTTSGTGYDGATLREAYGVASTVPTDGATATIATIQLSGWHESDLIHYAQENGIPLPPGEFTAVPIDGANPNVPQSTSPTNPPADLEVDLDQEALLAVAPNARQRAYFAPNELGGYLDALNAVGDDAAAANPDLHITALSTSWGRCEEDFAPGPTAYTAFEDALDYVLASGVTVFAASGDDGAADACVTAQGQPLTTPSVDFPASSPDVIAVGGTSLPNPADPATQGSWPDSGGGMSQQFARPFWQAGLGIPGNTRLVPDISSDADPATGFSFYSSDLPGGPGNATAGGTSLAAPTQAALLTDELESHGYSWGIGDIHAALYAAGGSPAFVDIADGGSNGAYTAGPGYDMVTGLGTPNWDNLVTSLAGSPHVSVTSYWQNRALVPVSVHLFGTAEQVVGWKTDVDVAPSCSSAGLSPTPPTAVPTVGGDGPHVLWVMALDHTGVCHFGVADVFVDTVAPTVSSTFGLASPTAPALAASWSATDPAPSSGLAYYRVVLAHAGGVDVLLARTATTSLRFPGVTPGRTYTLTVVAVDRAGNVSAPVTRAVTVPIDDPALARSPGWHEVAFPADYGGSAAWSTVPHAWLQYLGSARVFLALVTRTPDSGLVEVLVDGHLQGIVDLYSPVVRYRSPLLLAAFPQVGVHHVVIEALDRSDGVSAGTRVWVDALLPEA